MKKPREVGKATPLAGAEDCTLLSPASRNGKYSTQFKERTVIKQMLIDERTIIRNISSHCCRGRCRRPPSWLPPPRRLMSSSHSPGPGSGPSLAWPVIITGVIFDPWSSLAHSDSGSCLDLSLECGQGLRLTYSEHKAEKLPFMSPYFSLSERVFQIAV